MHARPAGPAHLHPNNLSASLHHPYTHLHFPWLSSCLSARVSTSLCRPHRSVACCRRVQGIRLVLKCPLLLPFKLAASACASNQAPPQQKFVFMHACGRHAGHSGQNQQASTPAFPPEPRTSSPDLSSSTSITLPPVSPYMATKFCVRLGHRQWCACQVSGAQGTHFR